MSTHSPTQLQLARESCGECLPLESSRSIRMMVECLERILATETLHNSSTSPAPLDVVEDLPQK